MRVIVDALFRGGDSDKTEHFDCPFAGHIPAPAARQIGRVRQDNLLDLLRDGQCRIERRQRVLHRHGDVASAQTPPSFVAQGPKVDAAEQDGASRDETRRAH